MKQVNLEEILNKHLANKIVLEIDWDDMHLIKRAMLEACNQTVDLCAENAKLNHNYYDKDEERALYNEHKDFGFERCDGDGIPYGVDVVELNKQSILDTKKQII